MIVVLGNPDEPMVEDVFDTLHERGASVELVDLRELPATVQFGANVDGGFLHLPDGRRLELDADTAIYHRVGFANTQIFVEYSEEERRFARQECLLALNAMLNGLPGLVVNRPSSACSNASKPDQIRLLRHLGWDVPRTVVTNRPDIAAAFYHQHPDGVIYKSISYLRSIVRRMSEADLDRLETLRNCPVQLQEAIQGVDYRVHVVGERVFASRLEAEESDYRYDKTLQVVPDEIPASLAGKCIETARCLGLHLAGIDLRKSGDRYVCFEVNPSPAFSWYEARGGQPITAAVCDLLQGHEATRGTDSHPVPPAEGAKQ
ncbi:MAG TPA: glutathione synthase [Candidatus Xenobia bacterium]|jgi:hypothetical protein